MFNYAEFLTIVFCFWGGLYFFAFLVLLIGKTKTAYAKREQQRLANANKI